MDGINLSETGAWRLLVTGQGSPAWNMALDEAILGDVVEGRTGPTVRIYTWDGAAVSVGRFQDVGATLRADLLSRHSIPVVRRPTGGRGVLHGGDLTVSVAAPIRSLAEAGCSADRGETAQEPLGVMASHFVMMRAIAIAMHRLGTAAMVGTGMHHAMHGDCFASSCGADVVAADGGKLAGGAQLRRAGCLLEQIAIRWRPTSVGPEQVFVGASPGLEYPFEAIREGDLIASVVSALADTFARDLRRGTLTEAEVSQIELRMSEHVVDLSPLM